MIRNTSGQYFHCIAFNAAGRVTGDAVNITMNIAQDHGTAAASNTANPTEIGTTGEYFFLLLDSETDGYELSFRPVSATGGVQVVGMPSNIIYTLSDVTPTYVVPQTTIDQTTVPAGSDLVYQASRWTITLEGVSDDDYASIDAVYFGMKSVDAADTASALQVRWDKTGNTTACTRINGLAAAGPQITQAVVTHSTYTPVATLLHRFILVVDGALTALVPTTNTLNGSTSMEVLNTQRSPIQYTGEWKFAGAVDDVIGRTTIVVMPSGVRTTE